MISSNVPHELITVPDAEERTADAELGFNIFVFIEIRLAELVSSNPWSVWLNTSSHHWTARPRPVILNLLRNSMSLAWFLRRMSRMGCALLGLATPAIRRSTSATGRTVRGAETLQTAEHVWPPTAPGARAAVQIAHSGVCFGRPYFYN